MRLRNAAGSANQGAIIDRALWTNKTGHQATKILTRQRRDSTAAAHGTSLHAWRIWPQFAIGFKVYLLWAAAAARNMSAALRRQGSTLLGRLARLGSTSSVAQQVQQQPNVIAAEVAQLVSLRGGMTVLPPDVAAAIDEAAKGGCGRGFPHEKFKRTSNTETRFVKRRQNGSLPHREAAGGVLLRPTCDTDHPTHPSPAQEPTARA